MRDTGLHVFDTAIGACGIAWNARGIIGVQLPEGSSQATLRRLARRFQTSVDADPDADARAAIEACVSLLAGGAPDMSRIALDLETTPDFNRQVYALARAIPRGETTTYGALAVRLGDAALAREIGQALGANPIPIIIPCHRVVAAAGHGGFSAHGGVATKLKMLAIEGAKGIQLAMF